MASYCEGILAKYADGLLVDAEPGADLVRAVKVKQVSKDEQRKTG